jgi:hypothetical protein
MIIFLHKYNQNKIHTNKMFRFFLKNGTFPIIVLSNTKAHFLARRTKLKFAEGVNTQVFMSKAVVAARSLIATKPFSRFRF